MTGFGPIHQQVFHRAPWSHTPEPQRGGIIPVLKGKQGEALAEADLIARGFDVTGKRVTFKIDGVRSQNDFVAVKDGVYYFVEVKYGTGTLSSGQRHNLGLADVGRKVIPLGGNAEKAGLAVGKPQSVRVLMIHVANGRVTYLTYQQFRSGEY